MSEPVIRRVGAREALVVDGLVAEPLETPERDGTVEDLLERARPGAGADHATVHSGDGHYRASIPLAFLRLASIDGGRLHVPDAPTRCWNVKDVVRIELTAGKQPDTVPD